MSWSPRRAPALSPAASSAARTGLLVAGAALTLVAAVLLSGAADRRADPEIAALLRAAMVAAPLTAAAYAWDQAPYRRFARLLAAVGGVTALTVLAESHSSVLYSVGRVSGWLLEVLLVALVLSFPTGRLTQRVDRRLAGAMAAAVGLLFLPTAVLARGFIVPSPYTSCTSRCPDNAFFALDHQPAFVDALLRPAGSVATVIIMMLVLVRLRASMRTALPAARQVLGPVIAIGALRVTLLGVGVVARQAGGDTPLTRTAAWLIALVTPGIAIAFLVGLMRARKYADRVVVSLATNVQDLPTDGDLRGALADAFDDPSIELLFPDDDRPGAWTTPDGVPAALPGEGSGRLAHVVREDDVVLAAIVCDESLAADPDLLDVASTLAGVALDHRRKDAEAQASAAALHEARDRLDVLLREERRRLERDLHDGAQQRLIALRIELGLAEELAWRDPGRCAARIHELQGAVDDALLELRALAHGGTPPALAEHGLEAALRDLAARCPLPVRLRVRGAGGYGPERECAVFFCVSEALQNAAKHAHGARRVVVDVAEHDGLLRFTVRDDGPGTPGRAAPGAGLHNMRERLAALGGRLEAGPGPRGGFEVRGILPIGQADPLTVPVPLVDGGR